jgi:hypothetical protein
LLRLSLVARKREDEHRVDRDAANAYLLQRKSTDLDENLIVDIVWNTRKELENALLLVTWLDNTL